MKRYLIASLLAAGFTNAQAATYLNTIIAGAGSNITFEDNSREQWFDENQNGRIDAGDKLKGFLKFDNLLPSNQSPNNSLYVTFSQTFGNDFKAVNLAPGLDHYNGTFSAVTLNFLEKNGGFTTDWITADLSGGVQTAITALEAEGFSAFKAGLVNADDFFAFQTNVLTPATNFVVNPNITKSVSTGISLGTFAAGLTITDINIAATFNRVIDVNFANLSGGLYGFGKKYDLGIVNGNFGGICNNPQNGCTNTVQNMKGGFIDNADAVINANFIPEPTIISLLGIGLLGLGASKRKNA